MNDTRIRDRILMGIGIAVILASFGFVIWTEIKHPCVAWEQRPCKRTECAVRTPMHVDSHGVMHTGTCIAWTSHEDTCTSCVQRKP